MMLDCQKLPTLQILRLNFLKSEPGILHLRVGAQMRYQQIQYLLPGQGTVSLAAIFVLRLARSAISLHALHAFG